MFSLHRAAIALVLMCWAPILAAQSAYPTKPIHMVVPLAAGSAVDNAMRILTQRMAENMGQGIVIDNQPGAAGLILCSPCNPTGAVYTHAEIRAIAQWAAAKKVWVIADEIYRRIHYGTGPAPSFLDLPDDLLERVVLITGVSKTYAMTGWRIGFALAPARIAKAMAALQSHTTTGANHPAQFAAAAALGDERVEQDVNRMVSEFRKRRDMVVGRFRQDLPGVEFVDPLGAFYFFFRVDSFGKITGTDFCTRLITQSGVALVPGAAFGDDRWVRLSYAAATDSIKQALDRIVTFARKLGD